MASDDFSVKPALLDRSVSRMAPSFKGHPLLFGELPILFFFCGDRSDSHPFVNRRILPFYLIKLLFLFSRRFSTGDALRSIVFASPDIPPAAALGSSLS